MVEKNTLLPVIPAMTKFLYRMRHFISKYIQYIWHIYISNILFWHSIWHSIREFYPAFNLAFIPTSHLAFYLASILIFSLTWALPDLNHERHWELAVPTEIWSSQLRSGSAHWDLELVVGREENGGGRKGGGRGRKETRNSGKIWRPSPGRWGKINVKSPTRIEQNQPSTQTLGRGIKAAEICSIL